MIPKSEWVYYGFAGHFICASRCAYHLNTRVGKYLISTVGAYRPTWDAEIEVIGASTHNDAFYETMVFPCEGEDIHGNPQRGEGEVENVRYADSLAAEQGHRNMCDKYACLGEAQ